MINFRWHRNSFRAFIEPSRTLSRSKALTFDRLFTFQIYLIQLEWNFKASLSCTRVWVERMFQLFGWKLRSDPWKVNKRNGANIDRNAGSWESTVFAFISVKSCRCKLFPIFHERIFACDPYIKIWAVELCVGVIKEKKRNEIVPLSNKINYLLSK